jgi:uncharacterized caspase-like protein
MGRCYKSVKRYYVTVTMVKTTNNKWAILIGINGYHNSLGSLKYAVSDCKVLRDTLLSGELGFNEDRVLLLDDTQDTEHRPTFANIHACLGSWLAAPEKDDLLLVYFAGHGRLVHGKTYLVPCDATISSIHTLGIPLQHVQDVIEQCKATQKILVLDACHSGAGRDVCTMSATMQNTLAQSKGIYTLSSCGIEEVSHEWDEKRQGVFSYYLTEALRGGCFPDADGRLTIEGLYEWVYERVSKWARDNLCSQTPQRFAKGAGSIVLSERGPDYAVLAEKYRKELAEAQAKLAEIQLKETKEQIAKKERAETDVKLGQLAEKFIAENSKLRGAARNAKWKSYIRKNLGELDALIDINSFLLEKQEQPTIKAAAAETSATFRFITVPAGVKISIYIDDELITADQNSIPVSGGRHTIRIIPDSLEWACKNFVINAEKDQQKIIVKMRRISVRSLLSFLLTIGFGFALSLLGLLMSVAIIPNMGGAAAMGYISAGLIASALMAVFLIFMLASIISFSRGLVFVFDAGLIVNNLPADTLIVAILLTTLTGWGLGWVLPFRYVFMAWAVGSAFLAGVLLCLIPWHGRYKKRDLI